MRQQERRRLLSDNGKAKQQNRKGYLSVSGHAGLEHVVSLFKSSELSKGSKFFEISSSNFYAPVQGEQQGFIDLRDIVSHDSKINKGIALPGKEDNRAIKWCQIVSSYILSIDSYWLKTPEHHSLTICPVTPQRKANLHKASSKINISKCIIQHIQNYLFMCTFVKNKQHRKKTHILPYLNCCPLVHRALL